MAVISGYDPNNPNKDSADNTATSTAMPATASSSPSATSAAPQTPKQTPSSGFQNFQQFSQANQQSGQRIGNLINNSVQQQAKQVGATTQSGDSTNAVQAEKDRIAQGVARVGSMVAPVANPDTSNQRQNYASAGATTSPDYISQPYLADRALPTNFSGTGSPGQNPINNITPTETFASLFTDPNAGAEDQVNMGLADWASKLATGATDSTNINNRAMAAYGLAGQQLSDLQSKQQQLNSESGRMQMLQDLLGKSGNYTSPASRLDQSLFQTNTNQLSSVLGGAASAYNSQNKNLSDAQANKDVLLGQLATAATQGKTDVGNLAKTGLSDLDTALTSTLGSTKEKQAATIKDIQDQFNSQTFDPEVAAKLGIGDSTTLFNILGNKSHQQQIADTDENKKFNADKQANITNLQNQLDNYASTGNDQVDSFGKAQLQTKLDKAKQQADQHSYQTVYDNAENANKYYSTSDPNQLKKSNVIDSAGLQKYAALSKLMGNDAGSFDYQKIGKVDPAYELKSDDFKQALSSLYENRAKEAETGSISGHGEDSYYDSFGRSHGTSADTNVAMKDLLDLNALRQGAAGIKDNIGKNTARVNEPGVELADPSKVVSGAAKGSVMGGIPGAIAGAVAALPGVDKFITGMGDNLAKTLTGTDRQGDADKAARIHAYENAQGNWQNYLQQQGYRDQAHIRKALQGK